MKANFPIKNNKSNDTKLDDTKLDDTKLDDTKLDEIISYEKHLTSLPEGWNLWSLRSSKKNL